MFTNAPVLQPLDEALLLAEYTAVRQEVLHGIDLQQRALQFGFGAAGVAITVAFQSAQAAEVRVILCYFLIPLVTYLTVLLWYGELSRCLRASYYLAVLERRNPILGRWVFCYDRWVRFGDDDAAALNARRPIIPWTYGGTLAILLLLPVVTAVIARDALDQDLSFRAPAHMFEYALGTHSLITAFIGVGVILGLKK
jgi:hypothetical protein